MSEELRKVDRVMLECQREQNFAVMRKIPEECEEWHNMKRLNKEIDALLTEQPNQQAGEQADLETENKKLRQLVVLTAQNYGVCFDEDDPHAPQNDEHVIEMLTHEFAEELASEPDAPQEVEPMKLQREHFASLEAQIAHDDVVEQRDQYKEKLDTLAGLVREYKLAEDDQAHAPKSIRVARADLFAYLDKLAAERPTPDTGESQ